MQLSHGWNTEEGRGWLNGWAGETHCSVRGGAVLQNKRLPDPIRVSSVFHPWLKNSSGLILITLDPIRVIRVIRG